MRWLPGEQLTWKAWRQAHPQGRVLSSRTGHQRDYTRLPYQEYFASPHTVFPVPEFRTELPKKAWVLGILVNGRAQGYPLETLESAGSVRDPVGGVAIEVRYDAEARRAQVTRLDREEPVPSVMAYWFAWQAFYPDTGLWNPPR